MKHSAIQTVVIGKNSVIGKSYHQHIQKREVDIVAVGSAECDLLSQQSVENFFSYQIDIPHALVIFSTINKRVRNDYTSFIDNTQMIQNLIHGIRSCNISSIIYLSSTDVYGLRPNLPIHEQTVLQPDTYYGLSKLACENMLLMPGQLKCPVTVLRIPGAYGMPGDVYGAIGILIRKILRHEIVTLSNKGATIRDYVYIDDISRAIDAFIESPYHGIINLASGQRCNIGNIVRIIQQETGASSEVLLNSNANGRDFDLVFNTDLFMSLFPSFRFTDLQEGIRTYIQQERSLNDSV